MSKIKRFEEIKARKSAKQLVMNIYESSGKGDFAKDWSLKDQIRTAAISTMSNIAEGYARNTDKEFARFLNIALGSTAEVQSQLYIARDLGYISDESFNSLYGLCSETARLIAGFINYLKKEAHG